jgi:hypothetical protein
VFFFRFKQVVFSPPCGDGGDRHTSSPYSAGERGRSVAACKHPMTLISDTSGFKAWEVGGGAGMGLPRTHVYASREGCEFAPVSD